jgi:D-serine deaminase-like pyridoxal phosphate-dependent protein
LKRRTFLFGALGAGAALWIGRPRDQGAPYDAYFRSLNDELKQNGPMHPCMVVDLDLLDANIAALRRSIRAPKRYRVVAKSLPSPKLIGYVSAKAATDRIMSFHQPFLNRVTEAFPATDVLLGKPMPARSARIFYDELRGSFDPSRQLQWLIDTPERLQQYLELARGLRTKLRTSIEIDVGLHRGGVASNQALDAILGQIAGNPERLELAGFMGYDPHVVKLPRALGSVEHFFRESLAAYQGFVDFTRRQYPALWREDLVLDGAGSPTYRLHEAETLVNDLSVGSALVKPTDFDVQTLSEHVPAAFIATPVLKTSEGVVIPGMEGMSKIFSWWDPNRRRTFFIYGGYWKAKYESPHGLRQNDLYGHSSNQEMANGSLAVDIGVDDHVFLRPTQSESVFLQFGDLVIVRGGRIVDRWPVLQA